MTRHQILDKARAVKNANLKATFWTRFWTRAKWNGKCLVWTGGVNGDGYGQMKRNGKYPMVHRLAWEFHHGKIPKGLQVLHDCDNPPCLLDAHLFLGTAQDNVNDCIKKGRRRYRHGETHHNAKLSEKQVREIRKSCRNGSPKSVMVALAKRFGVHPGHIRNVAYGLRR